MIKLSVIIPCYNEVKNISLILEKFEKVIQRPDIEVILVNNGSSDGSKELMERLINDYPFARIVHVEINQGYGFGIISGLKEAKGEYLGWTHADMQTDPYDVIRALTIIEEKGSPSNIYVKGDRKKRPFFDQLFTTAMSVFETIYLQERLYDINAQPNIFHSSYFASWDSPPYDFSLDLYSLYMARKQNIDIIRFKVVFPERLNGESSWNTGMGAKYKFIKRTLNFSKKLKGDLKNVHRSSY
ncbi:MULTISPECIES: glycosyltransferase family 2 protein [Paenibacillus]|jgi:glycosyltransferase involved in cell wall biosynthesis|uniref:glycosyltransferase family 2 protein n=1 Tax=Paenibacillus TaxID=44249 RepID=UPI0009D70DD1|nr:glycosyltransferase family 2 protein [Paenibacillus odorifer]